MTDWKIPEGKTFAEFFDIQQEALRGNTTGWPRLKSHDPRKKGKKTYLCIKYQCVGSCTNRCNMAHVDPEKIPEATRKIVNEKFKEVYG